MRSLALVLCLVFAVGAHGARKGGMRMLGQAGKCPPGQFYKPWDYSCMPCDANCAQACVDKDGCTACGPGYYTSRQDDEWPYECRPCTIPNCLTCRGLIYHAWPVQCEQCVGGFTQTSDRQGCVPFSTGGGSVEGSSLTRPPVQRAFPPPAQVPAVPPPMEGTPSIRLGPVYQMPPCLDSPSDTPAMDMVLPPRYVMPSKRPDVTSSFPTIPTTYAPTEPARPGPPVGPPVQLTFLPPAPEVPEPNPTPPPPVPVPRPPPPAPASPRPVVSPQLISRASCPSGSFMKMDGTCMECDQFCLDGQCSDNRGCNACQDGYFTRAVDPEWPNVCVLCELANCVKCVDKSYDAWPVLCAVCAPGYVLAPDRLCVPEGAEGEVDGESLHQRPPGAQGQFREVPGGDVPTSHAVPAKHPKGKGAGSRRPEPKGSAKATAKATARTAATATAVGAGDSDGALAVPEPYPAATGNYSGAQGKPQGSGSASAKATATAVGSSGRRRKGHPKAPGAGDGYPRPEGAGSGFVSTSAKASVTVVGSSTTGPAQTSLPEASSGPQGASPNQEGSGPASAIATATATPQEHRAGQSGPQQGGPDQDGSGSGSASATAKAVAGVTTAPGACPKGEFMKEHDRTCIKCDRYCEPEGCVDGMGCSQCKSGYYRSRRDTLWPFLCVECSAAISGCEVCADGVLDEKPECLVCADGQDPIDGNCPLDSALAGI